MKKFVLAASLVAIGSFANAQTDPRVAQLEKRLTTLEQQLSEVSSARGSASDTGLPLHGFADVSLGKVSPGKAGSNGAAVGGVDLYLTPQFGDRVKSLVELVFEIEEDGGLLTDLERMQIGYTFNDAATLWFGRFHTPYGYWNTGFHHGQQIQTAVSRPRVVNFEDAGGILPAHGTGFWLNGAFPSAAGRVGYDLYVTNAPEIAIDGTAASGNRGALDMKMGGKGEGFATMNGFNLSLRPAALQDLTIGLHGIGSKIDAVDDTGVVNTTQLRVGGAYAFFQDEHWEIIGEYYRFNNKDLTGGSGTHKSSAWFAQAGYEIGAFTPYLRAERASLDTTDNYFTVQASGDSHRRSVAGIRYALNPKAALKFEGSRTKFTDAGTAPTDFSEARLQLAVRF